MKQTEIVRIHEYGEDGEESTTLETYVCPSFSDDHPRYSHRQVYIESAASFLRNSPRGLSRENITGLWLSSDDDTVLGEMQRLAPRYFPNVGQESVIWISGRTAIRSNASQEQLATHSGDMARTI